MLLRNGAYDPTTRVRLGATSLAGEGDVARIERATHTPLGPGSIAIDVTADGAHHLQVWGEGGSWLADRHQRLTARATATPRITAQHPTLERAIRHVGHLQLPATDTPYHEVLPAILGQRITAAQAMLQWAALCEQFGEVAPGPLGLRLPPAPARLARVTSWEFHRLGIERQRASTLLVAARHAAFIDRTRGLDGAAARTALTALPGIGVWTAAVAIGVSHGDPDALPVGDFHVKNTVAHALTGKARGTDDDMLDTLAAYAGTRWLVVRVLEKAGLTAPRFAPKRRLLNIARL